MKKNYNLSIFLSFIGLWITSLFSNEFEIVLGFFLIFSFGILHGSNDILLINSFSDNKTKNVFIKILSSYLIIISSAVFLFYLLPGIALFLFILFSAFHFGEQHWEFKNISISKNLRNSFYFLYGLFILQILFMLNKDGVVTITEAITSHILPINLINYSFTINFIALLFLVFHLYKKSETFKHILALEVLYLIIFAVIFKVSTLIWGFTIYFILWHSIPSLHDQITFIFGDFNKINLFKYVKNAFPYWVVSLLGIAVVFYIFKDEQIFNAIFFSFIAAITFPHALVMNKMFTKNKKRN